MNQEQNNKLGLSMILFYVGLGLIVVAAIVFVWINIGEPFKISSLSEMKQTTYATYLDEKGYKAEDNSNNYYIYIYSTKFKINDWYDDLVIEYANYARTHSDKYPIYGMNYDDAANKDILSVLGTATKEGTDIPGLILIKDKAISKKFYGWTKLNNELTAAMNK